MKILIHQTENLHTEVIGFFLSAYQKEEIHISHRYQDSPYNWVEEYASHIGVSYQYVKKPVFSSYDRIIFLTSRDIITYLPQLKDVDSSRVLQIRHTEEDKYAPEFPNVSLTNLVKADQGNFLTVFPEALRQSPPSMERIVFSVFGLSKYSFPKKDVRGLVAFIQEIAKTNLPVSFKIVTRKCKEVEEIGSLPNVEMLYDLDAKSSGQLIRESHFILPIPKKGGCYFKNRMTGVVPMSLSYGVPMIAPADFLQIYELKSSLPYFISPVETIDKLLGLSLESYQQMQNDVEADLQNKLLQGRTVLDKTSKNTAGPTKLWH